MFHLTFRGQGSIKFYYLWPKFSLQFLNQPMLLFVSYFQYKYLNQFFNIAINILKPTLKSKQARQGPMNTQSLFTNIKPFNFKHRINFYKYKIDSNLYLSIRVQLKGRQLTFTGSLHYINGFQFEVSQKLWQMINQKVNLQESQFLFMYDRSSSTVIIYSKIKIGKLINTYFQKVTKQLLQKICLEAKIFLQTLYSFGQFNFSDRFNFKQSLAESKFKRNFINNLQSKCTSQKDSSQRDTYQSSDMTDQTNDDFQSVKKRSLQIITQLKSLTDVPVRLQNGQKGIQFHLLNPGQSIIRTGGFFVIQKLLCKIYKKNQYSQECKKFQFSFDKQQSMFFESSILMKETPCQLDILVKKTLKPQKKDDSQNLLKIQKQLAIIQQINDRKHLVKYYENSSNLKEESRKATHQKIQEEFTICNISNTFKSVKIPSFDYEKPFKKEIFMQFVPHTLSNVTSKRSLSLDQIMSASLQIVEAVRHLHSSKVIHRDLKPQNILIDFISNRTQFNVKIIDFAQSAIFYQQNRPNQKKTIDRTVVRQIFDRYDRKFYGFTVPYSPPECCYAKQNRLDKGINSFKIDSWSVAIILQEIYSGKQLINYFKAYAKDVVKNYENIPLQNYKSKSKRKGLKIWEEAINFLAIKNLTIKQEQRMSIEQIQKSLKNLSQEMKRLKPRRPIKS